MLNNPPLPPLFPPLPFAPPASLPFITVEGIGGVGKTVLAYTLANELRHKEVKVVHTREPGGTPCAEDLRELLVATARLETIQWSPESLILLFTAMRRSVMENVITPALATGKCVISDRFVDSTRVYQAFQNGPLRPYVDLLHSTFIGREPDLVFILDLDPVIADKRKRDRGDVKDLFVSKDLSHQSRLRDAYLGLAFEEAPRYFVLDAEKEQTSLTATALRATLAKIEELKTKSKEA